MKHTIESLLPHRPPFLFVDEVTTLGDGLIVGSRCFVKEEFFFAGHFPSYPVVPGVILVEAMAQCGGAGLVQSGKLPHNSLFFLAMVRDSKFRRQVVPDETVRFEIKTVRLTSKMLRQKGRGYVGTQRAFEADWMCILQSKPKAQQS